MPISWRNFRLGGLPIVAVLGVLAACRSVPPPPLTEGGMVRSGQVAYQGRTALIAEFMLRQSGAEDFNLELFKGTGVPLLTVRVVRGEVWVNGALGGRSWHGTAAGWVPDALAGWVGLADVFGRWPATDVPGWKIVAKRDGSGELRQLWAVRQSSGESFDFRFE